MILCLGIGKDQLEHPSFSSLASVHTLRYGFLTEGNGGNGGAAHLASLHIHDSHSHFLGKEKLTHPLFSPLAPVRFLFSQWEGIFSISSCEIRTELIAIRLE
jgi:hypothetical protein